MDLLAHAKLHNSNTENAKKLNHNEKEFQAEMTAYTVCSHFNIDTSDYSLLYLHSYTKDHEKINDKMQLLEEVKGTAYEFITHLEQDLVKEQELTSHSELSNPIEVDKQLQMNHGDIQIIIDDEVKQISDLSIQEFQTHFHDKHERNVLTQKEFEGLDSNEIIKAFNNLDDNWSKHNNNVKMIDNTLKEPHAYVVWSETNIKRDLMNIKDIDKELAKRNIDSFSESGYAKTRINFVIPAEDGINVKRADRIDLGDGYYNNLREHLKVQPDLSKLTPDNTDHLKDIYTSTAIANTIQKIYQENLHLKHQHNIDEFEVDLSNNNVKSIEKFSLENSIITRDELDDIKANVKKAFNEDNEYMNTTNQAINLKGQYEKYQKLLKAENTGGLTEEKLVNRMTAENTYSDMKIKALESNVLTEDIVSKMEKNINKQYEEGNHSEQQQTKTSPFDKSLKTKQKSTGLSM